MQKIKSMFLLLTFFIQATVYGSTYVLEDDMLIEPDQAMLMYYELGQSGKNYFSSISLKSKIEDIVYNRKNGIAVVTVKNGSDYVVYGLKLYEKKVLFRTQAYRDFVGSFWLDNCRFAVLMSNKPNGGDLVVNDIPGEVVKSQSLNCSKKNISLDEVPESEQPLYFWQSDELNLWAYYSNGSREIFKKLGNGKFYDIQASGNGNLYFKESYYADKIYKYEAKKKKSEEIVLGSDFELVSDDTFLYINKKSELYLYKGGDKKLISSGPVKRYYVDPINKKVFTVFKDGSSKLLKF